MLKIDCLSFMDWEPVSLALEKEETLCLQGASGSGKSLLLKAVADLIPHSGEVYFRNKACREFSPTDWRRQVMFISAEALWWDDRVGDHFTQEIKASHLEKLGLASDCADWSVSRLSMGERQRLGLLRALDREPQVLLLDEPTANLDDEATAAVESLILEYIESAGACAIWVTHDRAQSRRLAKRRYRMEDKKLEELR